MRRGGPFGSPMLMTVCSDLEMDEPVREFQLARLCWLGCGMRERGKGGERGKDILRRLTLRSVRLRLVPMLVLGVRFQSLFRAGILPLSLRLWLVTGEGSALEDAEELGMLSLLLVAMPSSAAEEVEGAARCLPLRVGMAMEVDIVMVGVDVSVF